MGVFKYNISRIVVMYYFGGEIVDKFKVGNSL